MTTLKSLQKEIDGIKLRNKKVESDKAWETSWTRKFTILLLTYIVVSIFFLSMNLENPFINAIVPSLGFLISTMTVPFVKRWWVGSHIK